jgi:hypothetical protein
MTYFAKVKFTDQAGMEREGNIIIRVTVTRGATIKVSISKTDKCTQGLNKTRGLVRRT